MRRAKAAPDGFYHMQTVSGDALSAPVKGKNLYLIDERGHASNGTNAEVNQSNGVIHVVCAVLVPR